MPSPETTWLVLDCETTGLLKPSSAALDDQPQIIELALVAVVGGGQDWFVRDELVWLFNPGKPLSAEITRITKLTDDDLKGAPTFGSALPQLSAAFADADGLVAHNLPFDKGMMDTELRRLGAEATFPYPAKQLCTVQETFHLKGRRMKLTELYQHALGHELKQTHRALDDARALAEICIAMGVFA